MGCCTKFLTVLVVVVAVVIGIVKTGALHKIGFFEYIDQMEDGEGNQFFKGMTPNLHAHAPWGFTHDAIPDLAGKNIIVTGANTGLGYWTAHHLAGAGAHVIMGCRSEAKCNKAAELIKSTTSKASVEPMLMDLGNLDSVKAFAANYKEKHQTLHSLILNAGIMTCPYGLTDDGIERQIGTNHFGHFVVARELEDVLVATATPESPTTVVAVSSAAHFASYKEGVKLSLEALNDEAAYETAQAYGQSKLANVLFAQELAERLADKNVLVNSVHPGMVHTELARHIYDLFWKFLPSAVAEKVVDFADARTKVMSWSPSDASLTQIFAAVGPSLIEEKVTGKYFHPIARLTKPHPHAANASLQKDFWKLTEEVLAKLGK